MSAGMAAVELLSQHTTIRTVAIGVTWDDVLFNLFYKYKIWAAIISFIVLSAVGVFALARMRAIGIGLLVLSVFVAGFFLTAERWINISVNTETELHHKAPGNPFHRA
ncbi:hypothetical protein C1Y40_00615 [Mycobacterium talmoniae]|uniref:Uncharacterized protein n=1 Tax=Mycobacterium talmoniae TaxID=1858794 RepID=A0A2S8BR92_9MYCO|nr:hypothetical protein [Mycobacterium eburneum]PQM49153.1 hypothetical protein C1Y40_00615 [Mycobacterium talmoniae]TDH48132.1 hypothetical protein E2F47_25035 [Mycobacterium eburneum]